MCIILITDGIIDWGDGQYDHGTQVKVGPFKKTHEYDKTFWGMRDYGITIKYVLPPAATLTTKSSLSMAFTSFERSLIELMSYGS